MNLGFKHKVQVSGKKEKVLEEGSDKFEERFLFQGLNLEIEPGTTNAIVGHSGFGKTTMLNLIVRIGPSITDFRIESTIHMRVKYCSMDKN